MCQYPVQYPGADLPEALSCLTGSFISPCSSPTVQITGRTSPLPHYTAPPMQRRLLQSPNTVQGDPGPQERTLSLQSCSCSLLLRHLTQIAVVFMLIGAHWSCCCKYHRSAMCWRPFWKTACVVTCPSEHMITFWYLLGYATSLLWSLCRRMHTPYFLYRIVEG